MFNRLKIVDRIDLCLACSNAMNISHNIEVYLSLSLENKGKVLVNKYQCEHKVKKV